MQPELGRIDGQVGPGDYFGLLLGWHPSLPHCLLAVVEQAPLHVER